MLGLRLDVLLAVVILGFTFMELVVPFANPWTELSELVSAYW